MLATSAQLLGAALCGLVQTLTLELRFPDPQVKHASGVGTAGFHMVEHRARILLTLTSCSAVEDLTPQNAGGSIRFNDSRWSFLTMCVCLAAWMSHNTVDPPAYLPAVARRVALSTYPVFLSHSSQQTIVRQLALPLLTHRFQPPLSPLYRSLSRHRSQPSKALDTRPAQSLPSKESPLPLPVAPGPVAQLARFAPFLSIKALPKIPTTVDQGVRFPLDHPHLAPMRLCWLRYILRRSRGFTSPAGHGTRLLRARNDDMLEILGRLKVHNLIIPVFLPPWLKTAWHSPPCPTALTSADATQLTKQPLALLSATRRLDIITFKPHPTINANSFGLEEFSKLGKKFSNPDPAAGPSSILIFIAPRFGHLTGPINHPDFASQDLPADGLTLRHPCFADRVLDGLPFAGTAILADPACFDGLCPSSEPVRMATPPPLPPLSLIRARSASDASPSADRRVRPRQNSLDQLSPTPLARFAPPPSSPSFPPVPRHDQLPPLVPGQEICNTQDVQSVLDSIRREANRPLVPFVRRLNVHAKSIEHGAQFVTTLLLHLDAHPQGDTAISLPEGVFACTPVKSKVSFLRDGHVWRIGVRTSGDEISFGPGPERAVYRQAVEKLATNHNMWQALPHSQYVVPLFTPGNVDVPSRQTLFQAQGSLLAIHCYTLGCGPLPISVWLLLALCVGRQAMLMPRKYLAALDPAAFDCLAPWFMFGPHDILPTHPLHPFNQFLMEVMDIQPSMIQSPRTQAVHDGWTILFLSKLLFNSTDVWEHPEFLALQRGFDIRIGPTTSFVAEFKGRDGVLPLLSRMYDLKVKSVNDVAPRLGWQILLRANNGTTPYYGALFRLLLLRYLEGVGHPLEIRGGLVDEAEWSKQINNSALRAGLLLQAASDNDLLPCNDTWRLKFRLIGLDARSDLDTTTETNPRPIHFHSCTYEADIKLTRPLEDLLLRSSIKLDDPNYVTAFDLWLHGQLLSRDHNTV
ncbi:hypothetical protein MVEN_01568400 [Mycena venus]|uniref:Uncharacterized protein n=1 Tax=Mycena venus TaxID=2733690 RepID=A0A8H6XS81_9AGAR|nr:hypothetical protein MVEN_01568400 [Mycena venus]